MGTKRRWELQVQYVNPEKKQSKFDNSESKNVPIQTKVSNIMERNGKKLWGFVMDLARYCDFT